MSSNVHKTPYGGHGPELLGVAWSLMGLTTFLLSLRIIARHRYVKTAGLQPLLWSWAAWTIATLGVSFLTVAVHYGLGNHIEIVEEAGTIVPAVKWQWVADAMISLAIGVGKFAVVTFYMEIEGKVHTTRQRCLVLLAASNLANNVVLVFLIFFQCSPPASLWDMSIPGRDCSLADVNLYYGIAGGAWNAATDVVLALYPIGILYALRIPRKLKIGLGCLLGLGMFTAVCSIIKTVEFKAVAASEDPTYQLTPLILWGIAEMWVILVTASIPPLWPLIKAISKRSADLSSQSRLRLVPSFSACKRPRRGISDSYLVDGENNCEKDDRSGTTVTEGNGEDRDKLKEIPGITVQRDIIQTYGVGRGSSVTCTAEALEKRVSDIQEHSK